jgi:CheY-like chemotaxis protein
VKHSILIVDDEPMTRDMLRMMLELAGYHIREAEDGLDALRQIETAVPDLVLLDVMMPGLDGFEVCATLRRMPETATLPVIMLSAKSAQESIQRGLAAGANKYLTKPITRQVLIDEIKELIGQSAPA